MRYYLFDADRNLLNTVFIEYPQANLVFFAIIINFRGGKMHKRCLRAETTVCLFFGWPRAWKRGRFARVDIRK
ncbi:hypothetical protein BC792_11547 [Sphingobacterium allocomposti]|jgi:hypothetical protein|uniref:Uncharacterized protein n=1 Tax=Sphingobacterium allocomposti TaxID=415956 RepID=A0A5S5DB79_9SPHI|nr:hypothetical protein BC792_11547 [Sphingobacterium composti Yoo et al. 2007 non Ten et al. 2007]